AFAANAIELLAAYEAGDDGLPDHFNFFGFAVVFAAKALGLEHFEFGRIFLPDVDELAAAYGGRAVLESFRVLAYNEFIGAQGHETARQDNVAGKDTFFFHVVVIERVR